jgi:flagellin-like protein
MIRETKTRSKDKSKRFIKDKQAVSPVIGVILMVAVTVVMAAIVGSFLYGFIGGGGAPPAVSATATYYERLAGGIVVATYVGGPDQEFVATNGIVVKAWNETGAALLNTTDVAAPTIDTVGGTVTFDKPTGMGAGNLTKATNHVVVTAKYKDDTTSVILDTWV